MKHELSFDKDRQLMGNFAVVLNRFHEINILTKEILLCFGAYIIHLHTVINGVMIEKLFHFYRPPMKLRESNVFSHICQSVRLGAGSPCNHCP